MSRRTAIIVLISTTKKLKFHIIVPLTVHTLGGMAAKFHILLGHLLGCSTLEPHYYGHRWDLAKATLRVTVIVS